MIQSEMHRCEGMPKVSITKMLIDGKWTGWMLHFAATSTEVNLGGTLHDIKHCPYCGKELK